MSDTSNAAPYLLLSTLPGDPKLGIERASAPPGAPLPVVLDGDVVQWFARPQITGGGPTRLGVGHYQYTTELEGVVFATNEPDSSRDWFLIPGNDEQTWLIATDPSGEYVWTAGEPKERIKIQSIRPGYAGQVFKFLRILE